MKISTEIVKPLIVEWCKNHKKTICKSFIPILPDKEFSKCLEIKNWKRESKGKGWSSNNIVREFDCRPFDSQLRAYVYTDETDSEILKVEVVGE